MRPKFVLILAIIVAALAAFAWFVDRDRPGSEERRRLADRLLKLDVDEVQRLSLAGQDGTVVLEKVVAEGEEGAAVSTDWKLVEPIQARADASRVTGLLTALTSLDLDRNLEGADRADYGLDTPRWQLTIETREAKTTLAVGSELTGLDRVAVEVDNGGVDLVAAYWLEQLSPDGTGWRSPDLFPHQRGDIERLHLTNADSSVALARDGEDFHIVEPVQDRADGEYVDALLAEVQNLSAEVFLDDSEDAENEALPAAELGRVEVGLVGGATWSASVIDAERLMVDGVAVRADATALNEAVARAAEDWRSRAWSPVDGFEVDSALVATADGEIRLEKADGDWTRDGEPIGFSAATGPLYALADAQAESFVPLANVQDRERELSVELTAGDTMYELQLFADTDGPGCAATIDDRDIALVVTQDSCDRVRQSVATMRAAEPVGAPEADNAEVQ